MVKMVELKIMFNLFMESAKVFSGQTNRIMDAFSLLLQLISTTNLNVPFSQTRITFMSVLSLKANVFINVSFNKNHKFISVALHL